MKEKPWAGRFKEGMNKKFEQFSQSVSFDYRLGIYDVQAGIAHIEMLSQKRIISKKDAQKIVQGLKKIEQEIRAGKFKFKPELEDVHMNIEARLFELIGETAGRLHISRSRNDLVAVDLRLWLKDELKIIQGRLKSIVQALLGKAEKQIGLIMPGFTHTRFAQPILFSHWLLAYAQMLIRDYQRFSQALKSADLCPLGSGALAGSNYPLERNLVAKRLGFSGITANSLDAVSDRDFLIEFACASVILMLHLGRLSEELIWLSGEAYKFFELPESLCAGSSIMPNKKNPDSAELIRGKAGRVFADLMALLVMLKGTPLSYNRDFQEDKPAVFDCADTVKNCLEMMELIIRGLKPNKREMEKACEQGYILATDLADYLVKKGMGFRQAHHAVGRLVRYCEENGKKFEELKLEEFRKVSQLFGKEVYKLFSLRASVEAKDVPGGTATKSVKAQIKKIKLILKK